MLHTQHQQHFQLQVSSGHFVFLQLLSAVFLSQSGMLLLWDGFLHHCHIYKHLSKAIRRKLPCNIFWYVAATRCEQRQTHHCFM